MGTVVDYTYRQPASIQLREALFPSLLFRPLAFLKVKASLRYEMAYCLALTLRVFLEHAPIVSDW